MNASIRGKASKSIKNKMLARRILAGAVAGTAALLGQSAQADYIYWDGTNNPGGWEALTSWSTVSNATTPDPATTVPGAADIAVFNIGGLLTPQTVNLNADQSALGLIFGDSSGNATGLVTLLGGGTDRTLTIGASSIQAVAPLAGATIGSTTAGQKVNIALDGSQTWLSYGSGALTFNNNITNAGATPITLTINSGGPNTGSATIINGNIVDNGAGTVALTIAGTGAGSNAAAPMSNVLTGTNTYTGATTVKGGLLLLDFSPVAAPADNIINNTTNSSALVMGGETPFSVYTPQGNVNQSSSPFLRLKAGAGETNSQRFNDTTVNAGQSSIVLEANGASTLTASLGSITRNGRATLNISSSTGAAPTAPAAAPVNIVTTTTANTNGILGPWATVGTGVNLNYAKNDGSNNIIANTATAAGADLGSMTDATFNYESGVANALATSQTGNTLRYTGAASTTAIGTNTLTLNGLMNAGTGAWTISSGAGGSLTIGDTKELVIISEKATSSSIITISAVIKDNVLGDGSGVTIGQVVPFNTDNRTNGTSLSGANTYTGTTTINYGYVFSGAAEVAGVSGSFGNGGNITFNGGSLTQNVVADFSARIKNSTSRIAFAFNGSSHTLNSPLASSNTGGAIFSTQVNGAGQLTLNAANAYLGDTTLGNTLGNTGLYIALGNKAAFSTGTVNSNAAGAISANTDLTGANKIANNWVNQQTWFKGANSIELGGSFAVNRPGLQNGFMVNDIDGGSLTLSGTVYLSPTVATSNLFQLFGRGTTNITGVIANNAIGNLNKTGVTFGSTGAVNLRAANTYTGDTYIQNGGMLNLDFSAATAPTANILAPAADSVLRLRGATLKLTGKAGTDNSQAAPVNNGTTIEPGASKLVLAPGAGGKMLFNAFAFGRNTGGTLDITLDGGTQDSTNGVVTTTVNDAGGIIKSITVGGNDWATKSGTNVVAYSAYTTNNAADTWTTATENITNSGAFTAPLTAARTINSLRFNADVATGPDLGGQLLTVNDGILVTSAVNSKALTIGTTAGSSLQGNAASGDLIVINHGTGTTALDIGANIVNNTAATTFTKAGKGLVSLSGTNTYTGATFATEGVLKLSSANALPGGIGVTGGLSNLTLRGGVIGLANGDFTRSIGTGVTQVQLTGNGGFAAYGADRTVNIGGASAALTWGIAIPIGASLILGSSDADGMVDFQNPIALGNQLDRTVQVDNGSAAIDAKLSGIISSGIACGLVKTGAGTLWLSAANTYVGETLVLDGTLTITNGAVVTGSLNTNSNIHVNGANAIFDLGNNHNQVSEGSFGQAVNGIIVENGGSITGTGTSTLSGQFYDVRGGSVSAILGDRAGGATSPLTKTTGGTVTLSGVNTYLGTTTVNAGTLAISSPGTLGAVTAPLAVNGGVLDLGATSQQVGAVSITGGTIQNGTLTGTSYTANNAGPALVSAVLAGAPGVTKAGAGTLVLSNANTYSGGTTVNAGTLQVNHADALGAGNLTVNTGATTVLNSSLGNAVVLSSLAVNGTGKLDVDNNSLVLTGGGAAGRDAVNALINSAYDAGAWDGAGITSSAAQASFATNGYDYKTLGIVLNNDLPNGPWATFQGRTVGSNDVLVKYTWGGDADLSGIVDIDDYFSIDTGYQTLGATGWVNGDFNRDGAINIDDYFIIDSMYIESGGALTLSQIAMRTADFGPSYMTTLMASVPEPTSLGMLALGATGLLSRRRRRE